MGLTITYAFQFKGTKSELKNKLEWLRERIKDLPVRSVGDVIEIKHAAGNARKRTLCSSSAPTR